AGDHGRVARQANTNFQGSFGSPFLRSERAMGWWFGRKSAPADARPFVPAWLQSDAAEEGFARSYQAQFEEVYRKNPVGQRAVRLVAGMLGSLTIDGPSTGPGQAAVELVKR